LAARLERVRVICGDWTRVTGPSVTWKHGVTAVFLDPPYSHAERDKQLYSHDNDVAADVRQWAIANGDNPT
jgi:site-specific DNA-adenine methylase